MHELVQKNKTLVASILLIIGSFLLLLFFLSGLGTKHSPSSTVRPLVHPSNPPPGNPEQSEEYKASMKRIHTEESLQIQKDAAVGKLLSSLPVTGKNFSLSYDYTLNLFLATININNPTAGNNELDTFLKTHGVASRDWIQNLHVESQ
jgi:hypothetical protein